MHFGRVTSGRHDTDDDDDDSTCDVSMYTLQCVSECVYVSWFIGVYALLLRAQLG